jgi:hypothetical protein
MTVIDPESCRRCTHERKYHGENNCTFKDCTCQGFYKYRESPGSARSKADQFLWEAAVALEAACETRAQLAKEMRDAVERFIREGIKR